MKLPTRYMALVTRNQLAEQVAPTYARLKNIDPNEAHRRLSAALRDLELIEGLQRRTWLSLQAKKPGLDDAALVEHLAKRLEKPRKWKAAPIKADDEGAWIALSILIDRGASVGSGEALDLLETGGGQRLLARGLELAGEHLAAELLR